MQALFVGLAAAAPAAPASATGGTTAPASVPGPADVVFERMAREAGLTLRRDGAIDLTQLAFYGSHPADHRDIQAAVEWSRNGMTQHDSDVIYAIVQKHMRAGYMPFARDADGRLLNPNDLLHRGRDEQGNLLPAAPGPAGSAAAADRPEPISIALRGMYLITADVQQQLDALRRVIAPQKMVLIKSLDGDECVRFLEPGNCRYVVRPISPLPSPP